jgi:GNAT superfamily N-acetyltransferase
VDLLVATLAQRPDLAPLLDLFPGAWPPFMYHDRVSALYYDDYVRQYSEFCVVAIDRNTPDRAVAKALSVPFTWEADPRADLPRGGYDEVILRAAADRVAGRTGNLVSPIEIAVQPDRRRHGLASLMLEALRRNTARLGFASMVAPVRPNLRHAHRDTPLASYVARTRDDGLPYDPWLRVHVRAGGQIVGITPCSMTIAGTLDEWRTWTGLPFDAPGPVDIPEALAPVHCDLSENHAVYVEPNVWVHHALSPDR